MARTRNRLLGGFAYAYLVGAIAVAAAIAGAYFLGRSDGKSLERSKWVDQQNADLRDANAKIIELTADKARMEKEHSARLASASAKFQEGLSDAKLQADDLSERLRKYHSLRKSTDTGSKAVHNLPRASPGPVRCDGPPADRLGEEHGQFLVAYAKRAQALAEQLIACQAIVRSDRQLR